ncbi:MAG: LemA family protein [Microthrixaceae bacterium]
MTPSTVTVAAIVLGVIALLLIAALLAVLAMYNRFARQRNLIEESWRQVDVELARRHDLIPNLVETVRGYAAHERAVFERVAAARTAAAAHCTDSPGVRQGFEESLGRAVTTVLALAESYPPLSANTGFLSLERELTLTEDRIAAARRFYNGNVRDYNTRVDTIPSSIVASLSGFRHASYFELTDPVARRVPDVDLFDVGRPLPPGPTAG